MNETNLTNSQFLIWLGQTQHPSAPIYNMVATFEIRGAIDPKRFQAALSRVVAESDALRSVFDDHDGVPRRRVLPDLNSGLELIDLTQDPASLSVWLEHRCARRLNLARCCFDTALIALPANAWLWYLNQHHLIADAWSTALVYRRVAECYLSLSESAGSPERTNNPMFEDYAAEQTTQAPPKSDAAHWRRRADRWAMLEPLTLYSERPTRPGTRCLRVTRDLGPERSAALDAMAKRDGVRSLNRDVTLFQLLLTALFAQLYRASGMATQTVGAPAANRPTRLDRRTIGLFMEIFSLEVTIDPGETLEGLLGKVREETFSFLRHARAGVSDVSTVTAFEVLLNFVKASFPGFANHPVQANFVNAGAMEAHHLLRLQVNDFEHDESLTVNFDFADGLFSGPLREAWADQYLRILDALVDDTACPLTEIDLLPTETRARVLFGLNQTAAPYPSSLTLHERFEAQARSNPRTLAVVDQRHKWTYGELDRRANQLAGALIRRGIEPSGHVAVMMPRSSDLILAMLATLKTTAVYLPVDPALPIERQALLLRLGRPGAAITAAGCGDPLRGPLSGLVDPRRVIDLDRDWSEIASAPALPIDRPVGLDDAAYLLFTSGSTGIPKGVICNHRGVVNLLDDFQDRSPLASGDVCSWWTSAGFDVSVYEIYSALFVGGTLYPIPDAVRMDPDRLHRWLAATSVRSAYLPPFLLRPIGDLTRERPSTLTLRRLLVGVEPIPLGVLHNLLEAQPGLEIINGYGPTEATICATLYSVPRSRDEGVDANRPTPIGRPVRNTRVYLLDACGQPVPFGAVGNLYLAGEGVARGYCDDEETTRRCFLPDRFATEPVDASSAPRMYRTGDLARYLPDGNLEFVGRIDHQLKIGGVRIEPAEVERTLREQPGVHDALVAALTPDGAQPRLVAYLIADQELTAAQWRAQLAGRLPSAMIPTDYVMLDAFPMTPGGKVDRDALPEPTRAAASESCDRSKTPLEATLVKIWGEVLGLDRVGTQDDFIDLGGDSLTALQIAARARDQGLEITPGQVFESTTIAALSKVAHLISGVGDVARIPGAGSPGAECPDDCPDGVSGMHRFTLGLNDPIRDGAPSESRENESGAKGNR